VTSSMPFARPTGKGPDAEHLPGFLGPRSRTRAIDDSKVRPCRSLRRQRYGAAPGSVERLAIWGVPRRHPYVRIWRGPPQSAGVIRARCSVRGCAAPIADSGAATYLARESVERTDQPDLAPSIWRSATSVRSMPIRLASRVLPHLHRQRPSSALRRERDGTSQRPIELPRALRHLVPVTQRAWNGMFGLPSTSNVRTCSSVPFLIRDREASSARPSPPTTGAAISVIKAQ
jgi:hypothetical protein